MNASAERLLWTRTFNGAGSLSDQANDVAVAADGSVYVAGSTEVAGQSANLLLRKYAPTGGLRWTRTFNGLANGYDAGFGVAVAPDGSVYVAGSTEVAAQSANLLLRKYTPTGGLRWTRTFNGLANGYDAGLGVAVAADGSVYVSGAFTVASQFDNLLLRKYTPRGALRWTRTYGGTGIDRGNGVAVATDGSVYVAGESNSAVLVRKYAPTGALRWTRTYGVGGARGSRVALAGDGSVYVVGQSYFPGQAENLLLLKYSPIGRLRWTRTYNGTSSEADSGLGVAVAANGNVYVSGYTLVFGQGNNLLFRKYSPAGRLLWTKTFNGAANSSDEGRGVAVAPDRSIYVTGSTQVAGQSANVLLLKYR